MSRTVTILKATTRAAAPPSTQLSAAEGRKGNALVSGVDHVTADVDLGRTTPLCVNHLALIE